MTPSLLLLFGTAVFALSGALRAGERHLDLFGVLVVATVTAAGGGTTRDLLLGSGPVSWVTDPVPLLVASSVGLVTFLRAPYGLHEDSWFLAADAIGLATFAVLGAQAAHDAGAAGAAAVVIGGISAVSGGILRDMLCGAAPLILREEVYASAAFGGAALFVLLTATGVGQNVAPLAAGTFAILARLGAARLNLALPRMTPTRQMERTRRQCASDPSE